MEILAEIQLAPCEATSETLISHPGSKCPTGGSGNKCPGFSSTLDPANTAEAAAFCPLLGLLSDWASYSALCCSVPLRRAVDHSFGCRGTYGDICCSHSTNNGNPGARSYVDTAPAFRSTW